MVGALNLEREDGEGRQVEKQQEERPLCPTPAPHISAYLHISPHISTYLHIYLHLTNKFGLYLHISSIPHPAITQHHHHNQDKLANPNQLRRNALFQNISQTCFKDVFRILLLEHSGSNNVDLWCYDIVFFCLAQF